MRNKKYLILIFPLNIIVNMICCSEADPLLMRKYTSLSVRSNTPSPDISLTGNQDHQKRRNTLWTAINKKEVELVKSSFEKEFEWVNRLYLQQCCSNKQMSKSTHEQLREKLQFTRQLFVEIDAAIAKEQDRQEWLRKLSMPGSITAECLCTDNCCKFLPQWANVIATVFAGGIILLYCNGKSPSRLSTQDPCDILPMGQEAQMFANCTQSSLQTHIPCVIFNPHNETQIKDMYDCCQNLIDAFCMSQVDYYNDQMYPKQMLHAWTPSMIVFPSILVVQVAFQISGYLYRRSKRLSEPITQLVEQKKQDLAQVEQEFNKIQILEDTNFQQL